MLRSPVGRRPELCLPIEAKSVKEWQPIASAPFDRDIQVSVIEKGEVHALVIPCRWSQNGWFRASTREQLFIDPTHWREWLAE
jgi:hypothetical protein